MDKLRNGFLDAQLRIVVRAKRRASEWQRASNIPTQTKKDQLALALLVVRTDPILFDPGGLGAEESGTERTGSTHMNLFAVQGGSR
ncbi:hypothetical protein XH83_01970 [Bradyrhizobium sp. CCBAU 53351]|nr:hypothetical protein XH83_01970 [Bradyrhizobium sp. CCBAU 53351]